MSADDEVLCSGQTVREHLAESERLRICATWVPSPFESAAARGIEVPCGQPQPCPLHDVATSATS